MRESTRERERARASTAEIEETHMGPKERYSKEACRSVPSQWYHSDEATSNRGRERERKERD